MRSIGSYLLSIGVVILFFTHVVMVLMAKLGGGVPDDLFMKQMIFAFVILFCGILVFRRSVIGGILYVIANVTYYIFVVPIDLSVITSTDTAIGLFTILFSAMVLLELLYAKVKQKAGGKDEKTDWYYKGEEYDRAMDERTDRNNYKL